MSETWVTVGDKEKLEPKVYYRYTAWLKLKDTAANIDKIKNLIVNAENFVSRLDSGLRTNFYKFKIMWLETPKPTGLADKFAVRITFVKREVVNPATIERSYPNGLTTVHTVQPAFMGVDDLVIVAAVIAGLIIVATVSFVILSSTFEKKIAGPLGDKLSGVFIVGLIVAVMYFRRKA